MERTLVETNSLNTRELLQTGTRSHSEPGGCVIINADDWGRDAQTTDQTLECFQKGTLSSASGMVFMEDSSRGADIAIDKGLDVGLHLNLSSPFTASGTSSPLVSHQQKIRQYLCANRFARVVYHPGLANSFEYAVNSQLEEFGRLYGKIPDRVDGHHHMHLAANVLLAKLIPAGTIVRRNFYFAPGEKNWFNRIYRRRVDRRLKQRYCLVDFLFSLPVVRAAGQLERISELGRRGIVELETHPINPDEFSFLTTGRIFEELGDVRVASGFVRSGTANGLLAHDSRLVT